MSWNDWSQLTIVHLSDLHFGKPHRFQAEVTPSGDRGSGLGIPRLVDSILTDLARRLWELTGPVGGSGPSASPALVDGMGQHSVRTIFAITGDLTETAAEGEFKEARELVQALHAAPAFQPPICADDVFIVPGNHDLAYAEVDASRRWASFCSFYEQHTGARRRSRPTPINPKAPQSLSRIIDQSENGLIVAEINSAAFVQKDSPESLRGHVDFETLERLQTELAKIPERARQNSIRVALIHHHPIVLPTLAEAARGYDAIVNAGRLLGLLKEFGFQLVLHGHKHSPQTFPYDSVSAWSGSGSQPMMVVSGGSAGSTGLPTSRDSCNTYNIISIKWQPKSSQARLQIETRGLVLYKPDNTELLPKHWRWQTLRIDDRLLKASPAQASLPSIARARTPDDEALETERDAEIKRCRRCFPAIEVLPSFHPDQGFEARMWIDGQRDKPGYKAPSRVEWRAGRLFGIIEIDGSVNPTFSATFEYYGPMLIQARMFWDDGYTASAFIFAHYPGSAGQNGAVVKSI